MNIEHWNIERLIGYASNPRKNDHAVDRVAAAIREFGFRVPVIAKTDGLVVDGHLRLKAAKKLGMTEIPVVLADDLTDAQIKAFRISVNRMAELADWDNELLALELADLEEMGFDLSLTGFDDDTLDDLMEKDPADGLTEDDAAPEPQETHTSQRGDIWMLGNHRLMCGDSTQAADLAALMDGEKADLVWTDPPYNVAIQGKAGKIMNDDMSADAFRAFLDAVYARYYENMREGAVIYVAHADSERVAFTDCFVKAGLKLSQVLIWAKQSATLSRQDFNWKHEPILYGWKEGTGHYFCKDFTLTTIIDDDIDIDKLKKEEMAIMLKQIKEQIPSTVIDFDRPTKSDLHPTMKPVGLVQRMVEWSSISGDIVLDLFGGSGSTMIACQKTNRNSRLMELDPKYCDVIIKRWQDFTGLSAVNSKTGESFKEAK